MNAQKMEEKLRSHLRFVSKLDKRRDYVGISNIGKCPRQAYKDLVHGFTDTDFAHQMSYAGYLFEQDAIARMSAMGFLRRSRAEHKEVFCPKNPIIRGHIDGESTLGDLVEIKTVTKQKFKIFQFHGRPLHEHIDQVQLYMRYGGWLNCMIIYICRETFEHKVFEVRYDLDLAEELEERMLDLADAVRYLQPPVCTCGKCGGMPGEQVSGFRKGGV